MTSSVGLRAKAVRKALGLKQADMAAKLMMSIQGWQHIETDKSIPGGVTLTKLSELGFSADWILTGTGKMYFESSALGTQEPLQNKVPKDFESSPHEASRNTTSGEIDVELLSRVTGMVTSVYSAHNIKLSSSDAVRVAGPYYMRLKANVVTGSEEERIALLGLLKIWLEQDISNANSKPNNSKASA